MVRYFVGFAVLAASAIAAADVVVPNVYSGIEGSDAFIMLNNTQRKHQIVIGASQLTGVIGHNISGLQFRLNGGVGAWPPSSFTMSNFDIKMGASVAPNAIGTTFSANFTGAATQVRAGSLSFTAGSWPGGGSPNGWGQVISFDTPYLYTGGNLAFEMTMSALPFVNNANAFDAAFTSSPGFMTDYSAAWGTNWTDTAAFAGANARVPISRLVSSPVPEPATLAVFGAGFVALIKRRRRSR